MAIKPRVIIHGGAGSMTRDNLSKESWLQYRKTLLSILHSTQDLLDLGKGDAIDAAVHAVTLLECDPAFNAGKGAVFTTAGRVELEASVMVSAGKNKRGAAVSMIKHVKHPIRLAAEILRRGDDQDQGGAQGHEHLSGDVAEQLARSYQLDMCDESYFWTRKRWEEHCRGLKNHQEVDASARPDGMPWSIDDPSWDGKEALSQGTVGAVVLDSHGTLCVATSTGGITNKLPGRIGDTPTLGAGFWAEQWLAQSEAGHSNVYSHLPNFLQQCLFSDALPNDKQPQNIRAVAMSGTGNGDSFLRTAAVHTAASIAQYGNKSLAHAVTSVAGTDGLLQKSAGDRWGKTGEGQGGIIGIDLLNGKSQVVFDFNCPSLMRAWFDNDGKPHCKVFKDDY